MMCDWTIRGPGNVAGRRQKGLLVAVGHQGNPWRGKRCHEVVGLQCEAAAHVRWSITECPGEDGLASEDRELAIVRRGAGETGAGGSPRVADRIRIGSSRISQAPVRRPRPPPAVIVPFDERSGLRLDGSRSPPTDRRSSDGDIVDAVLLV